MSIELVRIDDRFIHGLVVVGWVRALQCKQIVVANDKVATNELQKTLMKVATPKEIEVIIVSIKEAARLIKEGRFDAISTMVLIANPKDALRLVQEGVKIKSINIGGMKFTKDRKQLFPSISMNEEEINICRQLSNYGIEIEVRTPPDAPKVNLFDYI
jgi:mannose/fructose/N-acetylgalactosamine-specific phosphotransferase system component IIB